MTCVRSGGEEGGKLEILNSLAFDVLPVLKLTTLYTYVHMYFPLLAYFGSPRAFRILFKSSTLSALRERWGTIAELSSAFAWASVGMRLYLYSVVPSQMFSLLFGRSLQAKSG